MKKQSKNIKIYKYVQGENDTELFGKIGHWCVSPEVHKQLGIAVSALCGDIWYVTDTGFLQLRKTKSDTIHIRFLYSVDEKDLSTQESLVQNALKDNTEVSIIFTNDRKDSVIWKKFKFTPVEKEKGIFCKWVKQQPKK